MVIAVGLWKVTHRYILRSYTYLDFQITSTFKQHCVLISFSSSEVLETLRYLV